MRFNPDQPFDVQKLPPVTELETLPVLRKAASARAALGEFKGTSGQIPNDLILLNTLSLREALYSSEIENIVTTHDQLYREFNFDPEDQSPAAKEVYRYRDALLLGHNRLKENNFLSLNHVLEIQRTLVLNKAGLRNQTGTALKNQQTGAVIYTPPQDAERVRNLMENLMLYFNEKDDLLTDPLIRMAVIHHQFETIHPFFDGNGRTGRILNILYLMLAGLIEQPTFYLSRYFIQNKGEYYRLLQQVRVDGNWEPWLLFVLSGVEHTAKEGTQRIESLVSLMQNFKIRMRQNPKTEKVYSKELLENLFRHPYTRIEFVAEDTGKTYDTARRHLETLTENSFLDKFTAGRNSYYFNSELLKHLSDS